MVWWVGHVRRTPPLSYTKLVGQIAQANVK
jgi:hypothetical protein